MDPHERPTPKPRTRRAPVPAPDEELDPIVGRIGTRRDTPSGPAREHVDLPFAVPRRRRGEPVVQLNVRVPAEVAARLEEVARITGAPKSEIVESALRAAYESRETADP